ncbi:MAG: hypothetical protein ACAI43_16315 [Phycisphaerae bacterium]|nr:hypothetical protein [Tepidisphaeraceae bacterium]
MRHPLSALVIAIACLTSLAAPAAEEKKEQTPPEAVVKDALQKHYGTSSVGPDGKPHYSYTLEYKTIKWGEPYEGTWRSDGVPANTKTMVYPVRADFVMKRETIYTGATSKNPKAEHIVSTCGFFKDRFGEWTFRLKEQERADVK